MGKGLNICLYRRFSDVSEDDTKNSDFIVFGNFDMMDIQTITTLDGFSPVFLNRNNQQNNIFFDKYYIKLVRLPNDESNGFDYSFWEDFKKPEIRSNHFYGLLLLSFSKEVVRDNSSAQKLVEYFKDALKESCAKTNPKYNEEKNYFSDFHFAVYPMLGYFDLALLFNTNQLSDILEIVNQLKINPDIFNSSLIVGQRSQPQENEEPLQTQEDSVYLSIKLKIRSKASQKVCVSELYKKFGESINTDYIYNGNSDILVFNIPIYDVYKEYYTGGFFNPESSFMQKSVRRINSTLSYRAAVEKEPEKADNENAVKIQIPDSSVYSVNVYDERIKSFYKKLDEYRRAQRENFLSGRIVSGWYELIKLYEESVVYPYTFDIKRILNDFIDTTLTCVTESIDEISRFGMKSNNTIYFDYAELVRTFEFQLSSIRNSLSDYIKSISFSDLHLTDGGQLPHAAGVFTTKFLFAYNQIVSTFTKFIISKDKETHPLNIYNFLVISGNGDETLIEDCFYFLKNRYDSIRNLLKERKPFIIRIPERSLYNIQTTMFHLFHECMHKCGDRLRKNRFDHLLDYVCVQIAHNIVGYAFPSLLQYINSSQDLFVDDTDEFKKNVENIREKYLKQTEQNLFNILRVYVCKELKNGETLSKSDIILEQAKGVILNNVKVVLSDHLSQSDTFFADTYDLIQKSVLEMLKEIKSYYFSDFFAAVDNAISTYSYYIHNSGNKKENITLHMSLTRIFSALLEDEQPYHDAKSEEKIIYYSIKERLGEDFQKAENRIVELLTRIESGYTFSNKNEVSEQILQDIPEIKNCESYVDIIDAVFQYQSCEEEAKRLVEVIERNSVNNSIALAASVFKECYADVTSIVVLNTSLEEYIASFVLDNENAKIVFIDEALNVLRIGSVLKIYYNINLLSDLEDKKERIEKELKKYQLLNSNNFDNIWNALVALYKEYEKEQEYYYPLNNYLQQVIETFSGYDYDNKDLKGIRKLYKESSINNNLEIIIEHLYKLWSELAYG
jgi:hypothetical protein